MAAWEGDPSEQLARQVLLPALAWRAGEANAAARLAAVEALGGLLQRRLLPAEQAARLVETARALPLLRQVRPFPGKPRCPHYSLGAVLRSTLTQYLSGSLFLLPAPVISPQCLEDDYREGTRLGACTALGRLLTTGQAGSLPLLRDISNTPAAAPSSIRHQHELPPLASRAAVGGALPPGEAEQCLEALAKRLDDSSDAVRIAACTAATAAALDPSAQTISAAACGNLAALAVLHMDDANAGQSSPCNHGLTSWGIGKTVRT